MFKKTTLALLFTLPYFYMPPRAEGVQLKSIRLKVSKPATLHSLIYKNKASQLEKTFYNLNPLNNERLGLFLDLNGFLIGYSIDPFKNKIETKTTDVIFSTERLSHSKLSLNYQILKGFNTKALNAFGSEEDLVFLENTKSTKLEILGLHNLYTIKGPSLFNHFFLNKPKKSDRYKTSISLVGAWSLRRLKLENPQNIVFQPSFSTTAPVIFNKINAYSLNATVGPLFSFELKHNTSLFVESKAGLGYFKNLNSKQQLKQSGFEFIYSHGAGAAWTSNDERILIILKAWIQNSRHIKTFFGDLSFIYFF